MQSCKDQHAKCFSAVEGKVDGKECLLFAVSIWPCSLWTQLIAAFLAKADLMDAFKLAIMMYVACFAFSIFYILRRLLVERLLLLQAQQIYAFNQGKK